MKSRRGLDLSTEDAGVVAAFDQFSDRLLRVAPGVEEILDTRKRQPEEVVLIQACALLWLFGHTPAAQKEAAAEIHLAAGYSLNARETLWQQALELWHAKNFDRAASALESLTKEFPEDLLAAKAAEFLYYILGQQHSGPRFHDHMQRLRPAHAEDADFLAMDAFAHELCGDKSAARRSAEAALEQASCNPWAQHALEHVLLWEGNQEAAITLMQGWIGDWEASARPVHSHNAWHLSLAFLDRMEPDRAFEIFDAHVWLKTPEVVVEQLDSIALLWRAEMAGCEIDQARWKEILPHIAENARALFMPFASAHYAYALARSGEAEEVAGLLAAVEARANEDDPEAVRVWAPTGRPVVRAAAALGSGDAASAAECFDQAMPRITEIGGSDAQDDLFRFAYLDSLLRSGRKSDASAFLNNRLTQKTPSPLEEFLRRG